MSKERPLLDPMVDLTETAEKHRPRKLLLKITGAIALGACLSSAANINHNYEVAASNTATVDFRGEALDEANNHTAIVFIDGFGTNDADSLVRSVGAPIQEVADGQLWSINYGNAPLDGGAITEEIIEMAADRNVDTLYFAGYSAGGNIALATYESVLENSNLQVPLFIPISMSDGLEGLQPNKRNEGTQFAEIISTIPWLAYYDPVRFVGEMNNRQNQFTHKDNPIETVAAFTDAAVDVYDHMNSDQAPGTWLLFDQWLAIENAHPEERITKIGQDKSQPKPVFAYFGTGKPGSDYMVDDDLSGENICNYAENVDITCLKYDVPGAIHTRHDLTVEEYAETFREAKDDIRAALDKAHSDFYNTRDWLTPSQPQ
ncbi:MAG TPA: hypothetical protein VFS65_02615 [Candidatus Saccharimonadales bacterium]|nr:hypothetical protein [Candidatus Saccharimonadales bacterium]